MEIMAALGDSARWRIVELLAERPRSVGELAELTGLRQPQTTKHLQTLARAGVVTVHPLGQRRVYAVEAAPLAGLARRVRELVSVIEEHADERDVVARYQAAIEAEAAIAHQDRWADGRTFAFDRVLPVSPEVVWRHWLDPALLASWWAPPSMTVVECALEPGGRAVLEYRDADGTYRSEGHVHTADAPSRLVFDLSVLDATGDVSFTGTYSLTLTADPDGTHLRLDLGISATKVDAVPYIAGIGPGWDQVLNNLARTLEKEQS